MAIVLPFVKFFPTSVIESPRKTIFIRCIPFYIVYIFAAPPCTTWRCCFAYQECLLYKERIKAMQNCSRLAASCILLPHFSVHSLRHTFCTRMFEVESNHKAIQTIMGHAEISTTLDIYTHITEDTLKKSVQHMSEKIKLFG